MNIDTLQRRHLLALAGAFAAGSAVAQPAPYPSRPIRMIIPFAAGGGTDIVGRAVADRLAPQMKVSVVVDNREGAGGVIGAKVLASAPPDGYTIMLATSFLPMAHALYANPPYDPVKDFTPLAMVAAVRAVFVAPPDAPYRTLREMLDYIKANPGKLSYASTGKGSPSHIHTEDLLRTYGLVMQDIPYKQGSQAVTDTMSGRVAFYQLALPAALPFIQSGRLRAIAVSGSVRSKQAPDIPTIEESLGISDNGAGAWLGFVAPAGVPPEIAARLTREIQAAMETPQVRERMVATASEYLPMDPVSFSKKIAAETDIYTKLVRVLGLSNQ